VCCTRIFPTLVIAALACAPRAASDSAKPSIDQWLSEGNHQGPFKWTARALPVVLSNHQRLLARFQIQIDGADAAKRRGEGRFTFFFRLTDSQGRVFEDHNDYDLQAVEEGIKASELMCTDSAFVLPGDYQVAYAILDTATGEHVVRKDKLHVAPLHIEPLPQSWRGLPAVEFVPIKDKPQIWLLPDIVGRLNLPVSNRRPVRVDVLMNLTPAEQMHGQFGIQDQNLAVLFPALKALTQMTGDKLSINISLLDLARRRVAFHQENVQTPDWEKIGESLAEPTSASIDVGSLAKRARIAAFFGEQIEKSFQKPGACAVIVLTAPMNFDTPQDLEGLALNPSPDCTVFYIRRQVQLQNPAFTGSPLGGRRRGYAGPRAPMGTPPPEIPRRPINDQLESILKPLAPHLFDAFTPEDFRRDLAAIIAAIGSL
jgi:hypothetical protein